MAAWKREKGALMSLHPFRSLGDLELPLYQCEDDKTERRAWADRRQFSYSAYVPERRIVQEGDKSRIAATLTGPNKHRRNN